MNIVEYLDAHAAYDYGDYYKLICPRCGHKEAYIYKSDIDKWTQNSKYKIPIRCNRLKHCAFEGYVEELTEEGIQELQSKIQTAQVKNTKNSFITKDGISFLESLCKMSKNINGFTMDIRGLKNSLLKEYNIVYWKDGWIDFLNRKPSCFGIKYRSVSYQDRDVIIPIYNLNGRLDRLLLRSLDKKLDKKEIQVKLYPDSSELWNIAAIKTDCPYIFVTEGVYDALSIMQSNPNVQAIALPGVKKYKKLVKVILENWEDCKDKYFILAFDEDEAGKEFGAKFEILLTEKKINYVRMDLNGNKDSNDLLQKNPALLKFIIGQTIKKIKNRKEEKH